MAGGIAYQSIATLNVNLGTGDDTFNIQSTASVTTTTVANLGGIDTFNIGSRVGVSTPQSGGIVDGIQGLLDVEGAGLDMMNVDDSGSAASKTGTLTATTLLGLDMGAQGILYTGIQDLEISLGQGVEDLLVPTTDGGSTTIDGGSGSDQVNLQTTSGPVIVNGGSGTSTIDVGTAYNGSYFGVAVNHFAAPSAACSPRSTACSGSTAAAATARSTSTTPATPPTP